MNRKELLKALNQGRLSDYILSYESNATREHYNDIINLNRKVYMPYIEIRQMLNELYHQLYQEIYREVKDTI